jgi:hypothetical protein
MASSEGTLIVRSIDIPYVVCILSAPILDYGFSFSKELILQLYSKTLSKHSARLISKNLAHGSLFHTIRRELIQNNHKIFLPFMCVCFGKQRLWPPILCWDKVWCETTVTVAAAYDTTVNPAVLHKPSAATVTVIVPIDIL